MQVPPAQQITSGLGSSLMPANLAMQGQAIERIHVDGNIVKDPVALTRALQKMSLSLQQAATVAAAHPTASSMLIRNLVSIGGPFLVNHMLGRPYQGWLVSRPRGGLAEVYELATQPSPATQLQLYCNTSGVTFDLIVY